MQFKHERKQYSCDHCELQETRQSNVYKNKKEKPEGITYNCDKYDYIKQCINQIFLTRVYTKDKCMEDEQKTDDLIKEEIHEYMEKKEILKNRK